MIKDVEQLFVELIKVTELRKIDFKRDQYRLHDESSKSRFVKDVLCMTNAPGEDGYILLGVKSEKGKPRQLIGVSHHNDSSDLEAIVNSVIEEPIQFEYYSLCYQGKDFGLLHIPPSRARPHWPKKDYGVLKKHVFYTRRASGNREASFQEIREMFLPTIHISDITAEDLLQGGLKPDVTPIVIDALNMAQKQGNKRLSRFLETYISIGKRWPKMPESWRALIAGLPIVAEDIRAPSLNKVATLAREMGPYISKENRREYHRKMRPLLVSVLGEVQAFLQDAAIAGGFPIAIMTEPPSWLWKQGKSYKIEDSLIKGKWTYAIPSVVYEKVRDLPLGRTWAGVLFDIVSRLPDPDRQHGKVLGKAQLTSLLYQWCSTAPEDFKPPFQKIRRTPIRKLKKTLAGLYLGFSKDKTLEN